MRKLVELLGFLFLIQGAAGLIYEWIGWFRLWVVVRYLEFLQGYEIVANIGLIVLGLLALTVAWSGGDKKKA
ncbi:hypothetical protein FDA94_19085 [Herbidospora galbida]|uniref:Uncharacterized protein n=1 Tax=Herbidospora galbida TaxID=2575442 RepID=A0A4U3MD00_9ACTN|nr:hypothetical protein [Herbidospora galbida]TKK87218.1 hypothetical protein FDA94_19085 [Herbidospora galbida]